MPAYFVHGGARLDVDDIPLEVYAKISAETGLEWWEVAPSPMANTKAAQMLFAAACEIAGVDPPAKLTPKTLFAGFKIEVGENRATEYNDGIPDPKAEAEPETT
jgi:hypothetical protein